MEIEAVLVALDVGTSKVVALVGEVTREGTVNIIGKGTAASNGLKKGQVINIEQTAVIKTFSVVAVALMPPTLIASIYGMNFAHMPELAWGLGYPIALVLMGVSAVLPVVYFRRKGWL